MESRVLNSVFFKVIFTGQIYVRLFHLSAGLQFGREAVREAGAAVPAVPRAAVPAVPLRLQSQGAQVGPRQRRQRQEAQDER